MAARSNRFGRLQLYWGKGESRCGFVKTLDLSGVSGECSHVALYFHAGCRRRND